jgi:hypothetical protein
MHDKASVVSETPKRTRLLLSGFQGDGCMETNETCLLVAR